MLLESLQKYMMIMKQEIVDLRSILYNFRPRSRRVRIRSWPATWTSYSATKASAGRPLSILQATSMRISDEA